MFEVLLNGIKLTFSHKKELGNFFEMYFSHSNLELDLFKILFQIKIFNTQTKSLTKFQFCCIEEQSCYFTIRKFGHKGMSSPTSKPLLKPSFTSVEEQSDDCEHKKPISVLHFWLDLGGS